MKFNSIRINDIKCIVWYVPLELNHSSYILSSTLLFAKQNNIEFKISNKNLNKRGQINVLNDKVRYTDHWFSKVTYVDFILHSNKKIRLAFDLNDLGYYFSRHAFKIADVVYKRSYNPKFINRLATSKKSKIKKMGLPFMVRPNESPEPLKLCFNYLIFRFKQYVKPNRSVFSRGIKIFPLVYKELKRFFYTRKVSDFEVVSLNLNNNIFYQKRLFYSKDVDVKNLTEQRVNMIQILKNSFGDVFKGGLMEDSLSVKLYPEIISNISGDQHAFLEEMKNCGICIYTRGLKKSTGWTLSEFMSQGKCIIAEQIYNDLPFKIRHDVEVMFYNSDEEMIEFCKQLVLDENKRKELGENARKYYDRYVNPKTFLESLLKN
ncbi:glycosyltransferase [Winogradskyella vidalii]|uniref:glycosyltransferase n=1 Tax=Winogradskyella vidalii TaxID=2615024 RepID=UPI0015CDCAEB|nr:glycosyltransferase [Winogradskyella vidalii]